MNDADTGHAQRDGGVNQFFDFGVERRAHPEHIGRAVLAHGRCAGHGADHRKIANGFNDSRAGARAQGAQDAEHGAVGLEGLRIGFGQVRLELVVRGDQLDLGAVDAASLVHRIEIGRGPFHQVAANAFFKAGLVYRGAQAQRARLRP